MNQLELVKQSLAKGANLIQGDYFTLPGYMGSPISDVFCWGIAVFIIFALCLLLTRLYFKFSYDNLTLLGFSLLLALLSANLLEDYFYRYFNGATVYATVTESTELGCKVKVSVYYNISYQRKVAQELLLDRSSDCSDYYIPKSGDVIPLHVLPGKPELTAPGGAPIKYFSWVVSTVALFVIWLLALMSTELSTKKPSKEKSKKEVTVQIENSPLSTPKLKGKHLKREKRRKQKEQKEQGKREEQEKHKRQEEQKEQDKRKEQEKQDKKQQDKWFEKIYHDKLLPLLTDYETERKASHKECWKKGFIWPPLSLVFICLIMYLISNFWPGFVEDLGFFAILFLTLGPFVLFIFAVDNAYSPLRDFKKHWHNVFVNKACNIFGDITYCKESIEYKADSHEGHGNFNIKNFTDMKIIPEFYDDDLFHLSLSDVKVPIFERGNSTNIALEDFIEGNINNRYFSWVETHITIDSGRQSEKHLKQYIDVFKGFLMAVEVKKSFKGNILITTNCSTRYRRLCGLDEDVLTGDLAYTAAQVDHATFNEKYAVYVKDNDDISQLLTSEFIDSFLSATSKYSKTKVTAAFYNGQFLLVIRNQQELFEALNADTKINDVKKIVIDILRDLKNIHEMAEKLLSD